MKTTLAGSSFPRGVVARLRRANRAFAAGFPGESDRRQPVHTVYGGAHLFKSTTAQRASEIALAALRENAPDFAAFARALALPEAERLPDAPAEVEALDRRIAASPTDRRQRGWLAHAIHRRVADKLAREAVEDFRIDFEDGYGNRGDTEEDGHAVQAAMEVARGAAERTLPPFIGIRIKPFTEELLARSLRTLDLFVTALVDATRGRLPENFVVTLPKVTIPEQVATLVALFETLERRRQLARGALKLELMIETTQSVFDRRGQAALPALIAAAKGRCTGAHFGTYDYTASCNITAAHQHMAHPACDFAKQVMKVALAGTGIFLSDGATNIMPVGPHRAPKDGPPLTGPQLAENRTAVHRAWRIAAGHIHHSLVNGFYQGWDLHPAQLPVRYGAVYAFFLEGLESAGNRLRSFIEKAAQATLLGDVFDDAATGQGLLNYFLRAINCGAISTDEAQSMSGLSAAEIRSRSFVKILDGRRR